MNPIERFLEFLNLLERAASHWAEYGRLLVVTAFAIPATIIVLGLLGSLPFLYLKVALTTHPLLAAYLLIVFGIVTYLYWTGYFNEDAEIRQGRKIDSEQSIMRRNQKSIRPVSRIKRGGQ